MNNYPSPPTSSQRQFSQGSPHQQEIAQRNDPSQQAASPHHGLTPSQMANPAYISVVQVRSPFIAYVIPGSQNRDPMFPERKVGTNCSSSQSVTCVACKAKVTTNIEKSLNATGWLLCVVLCIIFPPCCLVPLFLDTSYDHNHTCPNCKANLSYQI